MPKLKSSQSPKLKPSQSPTCKKSLPRFGKMVTQTPNSKYSSMDNEAWM